jgi:hypothetical protein
MGVAAHSFNEASQFFNQKIKEAVVQLRKDLPRAAITCLDVYLLQSPKRGKYILLYSLAPEFSLNNSY